MSCPTEKILATRHEVTRMCPLALRAARLFKEHLQTLCPGLELEVRLYDAAAVFTEEMARLALAGARRFAEGTIEVLARAGYP